jgi:hypothetical protein
VRLIGGGDRGRRERPLGGGLHRVEQREDGGLCSST